MAESAERLRGAKTIQIQASLAGGEARLMSGQSMPCVFMRKALKD